MKLDDVQAVITSAKARGTEPLERFLEKRLPDATEQERREATDVAVQVIDTVPLVLAQARQEAVERGVSATVEPILDHAVRYFMQPVDLIPEMTQGLAGLLDDAYLVYRVLQNLEKGPAPLLGARLDEPLAFLRRILSSDMIKRLDEISLVAMHELQDNLNRLWSEAAFDA